MNQSLLISGMIIWGHLKNSFWWYETMSTKIAWSITFACFLTLLTKFIGDFCLTVREIGSAFGFSLPVIIISILGKCHMFHSILYLGIPHVTIQPSKKNVYCGDPNQTTNLKMIVWIFYPRLKSLCFCKGKWFRSLGGYYGYLFSNCCYYWWLSNPVPIQRYFVHVIIFQGLHSHPFEEDLSQEFSPPSRFLNVSAWHSRRDGWNALSRTYQWFRNSIEPRLFPFANFFRNFPRKLPKNSFHTNKKIKTPVWKTFFSGNGIFFKTT